MSDTESHAEKAARLASDTAADASWAVSDRLALAQVHATLALVDAIESWRPPAEPEEVDPEPMTMEEFASKWG